MKEGRMSIEEIARALGATEIVPLKYVDYTPIGMMALVEQVRRIQEERRPGPGRPADPDRTVPRIVKFRPAVWRKLGDMARERSRGGGRKVSPAQLAAMLIELGLAQAPKSRRGRKTIAARDGSSPGTA